MKTLFWYLCVLVLTVSCNQETVSKSNFPCTLTQQANGVLIECSDGTSGFVSNGQDGPTGPKGDQGNQGEQGPKGEDGYTPELFQLCPGDSAQFPEQGIRIDTTIYAVYWDTTHGAFLSRLVPGTYRTTNGSNCMFRVLVNGTTEAL